MPDILFFQAGLPAGVLNRQRTDIVTGTDVDITASNVLLANAEFAVLDRPPGSASVLTGAGLTRQLDPDLAGGYRVRIRDTSLPVATRDVIHTFNVKTPLGLILATANERADQTANEFDTDPGTWVDDSESNEGGTFKGWATQQNANLNLLEAGIFARLALAGGIMTGSIQFAAGANIELLSVDGTSFSVSFASAVTTGNGASITLTGQDGDGSGGGGQVGSTGGNGGPTGNGGTAFTNGGFSSAGGANTGRGGATGGMGGLHNGGVPIGGQAFALGGNIQGTAGGTTGGVLLQTGIDNTTSGSVTAGNIVANLLNSGAATPGTMQLQEDGTAYLTFDGDVNVTPPNLRDFTVTTTGGGIAAINAYTFPDLNVDTFSFPDSDGTGGDVLTTDGAGVWTMQAPAGVATGLQSEYDVGFAISVAINPVTITNSTDAVDALNIAKSGANGGDGLSVSMATATTGMGLSVVSDAGSIGTALSVVQDGGGIALDVSGVSTSQIVLNAAGALALDSAVGQDVSIIANANFVAVATTGNANLDALAGSVIIDAVSAGVLALQVAGNTKFELGIVGNVDVTPSNLQDFTVTTTGGGISRFNGPMEIVDATAVDTLAISKSGAVAGDALSVTMATTTTGRGVQVTMAAGSTGDALRIDQNGGGFALDVRGFGISSLSLDTVGIFNLQTANNQAATFRTAGTGQMRVFSGGTATVDSTTGNVELHDNGAPRWVSLQTGAIDVTPGAGADFTATFGVGSSAVFNAPATTADAITVNKTGAGAGRGIHVSMATATTGTALSATLDAGSSGVGVLVNQNGTGRVAQFLQGGLNRFEIDAAGAIFLTAADDQNVDIQAGGTAQALFSTTGSGPVVVSAEDTGDVFVEAVNGGSVFIDAAMGELNLEDVGGSGLTLSQGPDDRVLLTSGVNGVFGGVTSLVAAFNRLAERAAVHSGVEEASIIYSDTAFTSDVSITLPDISETYIIEGTALMVHSNINLVTKFRIRNTSDSINVGQQLVTEVASTAERKGLIVRSEVSTTGGGGVKNLEIQYGVDSGPGSMTISHQVLTARVR